MDISEINKTVNELEQISIFIKKDLDKCILLSKQAFSFTGNWRDKDSFIKRIPILERELSENDSKLNIMKLQKAEMDKQIENENLILAAKKIADEKALEIKVTNPMMFMDI